MERLGLIYGLLIGDSLHNYINPFVDLQNPSHIF